MSAAHCDRCASNRFRNDDCLVEGHPCMAGVDSAQVLRWLDDTLPA